MAHISHKVKIGSSAIGGGLPVAVQTMLNCSTLDTRECLCQISRIRDKGCRIVRLTVQGPREAENTAEIKQQILQRGWSDMILVADVHFTAKVALLVAPHVDKVRINPGNFNDPDGTLFARLVDLCRQNGTAIRIGVNHGSLSDRMVELWGDTPRGMVESAMQYLDRCAQLDFDRVVVSMKSSNVRVMVHAYRMLAGYMAAKGYTHPLHLGVTEAGDGMEGRIKSAVGIATLLGEGIGDTIRVSLTEPPENEIPFAQKVAGYFSGIPIRSDRLAGALEYCRRESAAVGNVGGDNPPLLWDELSEHAREKTLSGDIAVLHAANLQDAFAWRAAIEDMDERADQRPVILSRDYPAMDDQEFFAAASSEFGPLLVDGRVDAVRISREGVADDNPTLREAALCLFQAARVRMSRTEYIACPGCGRTLYDLEGTLARIKKYTSHLNHLKIGVMGCIVNGPGEMADADYGYVGSGPGLVTLYKGKNVCRRAVPQAEAIEALVALIKENGDWKEPLQVKER